jgi:hypothetical protein
MHFTIDNSFVFFNFVIKDQYQDISVIIYLNTFLIENILKSSDKFYIWGPPQQKGGFG